MKHPRYVVAVKPDYMKTNEDHFSKLLVLRLVKSDKDESITYRVKKYIFLAEVLSWEEGTHEFSELDEPTLFIVTPNEMFYIIGNFKEFTEVMDKFINTLREN